jgi:hypothetical protein
MAKLHIVDDFYVVWLLPDDIPQIGIVFPQSGDEEPLIGAPLALPMGWVNSPPYFAATIDTACDIANDKLNAAEFFPAHRLDEVAKSCPSVNPQDAASSIYLHSLLPCPLCRRPLPPLQPSNNARGHS